MNSVVMEVVKYGGDSIAEWLLRIFNRCIETGVMREYWKVALISPEYKGRSKCVNHGGVSILSIPRMLYD